MVGLSQGSKATEAMAPGAFWLGTPIFQDILVGSGVLEVDAPCCMCCIYVVRSA